MHDDIYHLESIMTTAKVFMNGRSQAIRLPKEFRVSTEEVFIRKTSDGILIQERDPWDILEDAALEISDDLQLPKREKDPLPSKYLDLE